MRITANNIEELRDQIEKRIEIARQRTTDRLYDKLMDYITQYVYSYNETWEGRSQSLYNDFTVIYDAFPNGDYQGMIGDSNEILEDNSEYEFSPNTFDHGNNDYGEFPLSALVDYVNGGSKKNYYRYNFPVMKARPFKTKFEEYAQKHGTDIFLAECNKLGLNLRKGSINMSARMFV